MHNLVHLLLNVAKSLMLIVVALFFVFRAVVLLTLFKGKTITKVKREFVIAIAILIILLSILMIVVVTLSWEEMGTSVFNPHSWWFWPEVR